MMDLTPLLETEWACPCDPPNTYDCWEFTSMIRREFYGKSTPIRIPATDRTIDTRDEFGNRSGFRQVDAPQPGSIVLVGNPANHCGVSIGPRAVAHVGEKWGARIDDPITLQRAFGQVTYWEVCDA